MRIPDWSPDSLKEPQSLQLFVKVFARSAQGARTTEAERLSIVPLVFGLLPHSAIVRSKADQQVKPAIREHLGSLGISFDEELVATLKRVADQYFETGDQNFGKQRQKIGIESVRALRLGIYSRLQTNQGNRCAVCGVRFGSGVAETLDHILPWRLAGDEYDGSNWQLLCGDCNRGKREWLSALQSAQACNWLYGLAERATTVPTAETRYLGFALAGRCEQNGCGVAPRDGELSLKRRRETGLAILTNLIVVCANHAGLPFATIAPSGDDAKTAQAARPKSESKHETNSAENWRGYRLTKRVTSGGMADCFRGEQEETGARVFIKRVSERSDKMDALQREAAIYQKLERSGSEHTPRVLELLRAEGYLALVTELADCDLEEFVTERGGSLPTNEVKRIAWEIIEGLQELHRAEIVHRDLKPRNVLRCNDRWILADFGISKDRLGAMGGRTFRQAGTSGYAAPEQLLSGVEADPSADVYALGKVMVFLLTAGTDLDLVQFRQWRKLIRDCTEEKQEKRPSLAEVSVALEGIEE